MEESRLIRIEYTGEKYYHNFLNIHTGETKSVECTKEDYEDVSLRDDVSKHPVSDETWKWTGSNPRGLEIKDWEFAEVDGKIYLNQGKGEGGFPNIGVYSLEEFKNLWQ